MPKKATGQKQRKPQPLDKRTGKAVDKLNELLIEAHDGGQSPIIALTRKPGRNAVICQVQFGGLSG